MAAQRPHTRNFFLRNNNFKNYTVGLVNGIFDASSGLFLIFKLLYESRPDYPCHFMFLIYAASTVIDINYI